jgi:RecA/RadA recombinase
MPKRKKVTSDSFSLLESSDFASQVRESMLGMAAKRKTASNVVCLDEVARDFIKFDSILLQSTIGMCGIPNGTLLEIIGQDGVGKSSLLFTIAGQAMAQGSPFFYVETENKLMDEARVKRCLNTDPTVAEKMYSLITSQQCDDIPSMVTAIEDFADSCRNNGVPMNVPIVCAVDSFSKLMSPTESVGRSFYSGSDTGKKEFGTDKVNFGHAKFAHQWCRILPSWLRQKNVILLVVSHQNQKVDTGFGGGSFMSADVAAAYNRTKIGGNAFNQNAALQIILTRKGFAKQGTEKVGQIVKLTVAKNSYGPEGQTCDFEIVSKPYLDTDIYKQPSVFFANTTCSWLALNKYFGVTESRKRYTCEALGIVSAKPEDFYAAFKDSDLPNDLGRDLSVIGYAVPDTAEEQLATAVTVDAEEEEVSGD